VEDIKMKCELCGKECIRTSVIKRCPECLLIVDVVKEPEVIEEVMEEAPVRAPAKSKKKS